jgi:hypothetical protein
MRDATFVGTGVTVGPISLDLDLGDRAFLACGSARDAETVALLAAGIVKASSGCVLIDDYDPRVQSVACKRVAAFVPHEPLDLDEREFAQYVAYRAALWNVEAARARLHAALLRKRLAGMHEAFAYPLIGALIAMPRLIVLDRPEPTFAASILEVAGGRALLSTHADADSARSFKESGANRSQSRRA